MFPEGSLKEAQIILDEILLNGIRNKFKIDTNYISPLRNIANSEERTREFNRMREEAVSNTGTKEK